MFTRTLFAVALATATSAASYTVKDFCRAESQKFGDDKFYGTLGPTDTTAGLNKVAERAIYYTRTRGIEVCYDENYIHGLDLELAHDSSKDPNGVYVLEYVQPQTLKADPQNGSDTVQIPMDGSAAGTCEWIQLPLGTNIRYIGFTSEKSAIRAMDIELSNNRKYHFGYEVTRPEYKYFDSSSFSVGEYALIGFAGQVDNLHNIGESAEPHLKTVSLIYNKCNDKELYEMTQGQFPSPESAGLPAEQEQITYPIDHSNDLIQKLETTTTTPIDHSNDFIQRVKEVVAATQPIDHSGDRIERLGTITTTPIDHSGDLIKRLQDELDTKDIDHSQDLIERLHNAVEVHAIDHSEDVITSLHREIDNYGTKIKSQDWNKVSIASDHGAAGVTSDVHADYNDQLQSQNTTITILVAVVVFMGTLLMTFCAYLILKNRGILFKKGGERDEDGPKTLRVDISDFSSVASDSPVKQKREAYRARAVPADSITSLSQIGVPESVVMPDKEDSMNQV